MKIQPWDALCQTYEGTFVAQPEGCIIWRKSFSFIYRRQKNRKSLSEALNFKELMVNCRTPLYGQTDSKPESLLLKVSCSKQFGAKKKLFTQHDKSAAINAGVAPKIFLCCGFPSPLQIFLFVIVVSMSICGRITTQACVSIVGSPSKKMSAHKSSTNPRNHVDMMASAQFKMYRDILDWYVLI